MSWGLLRFHLDDGGTENLYLLGNDGSTLDWWNMPPQAPTTNEGRAWDGGPRGYLPTADFEGCKYREVNPASPYPQTLGSLNHSQARKYLELVSSSNATAVFLNWRDVGQIPSVWRYSPKQHDNFAINVEGIAYRDTNEMIIGLRSPLRNRMGESVPINKCLNRVTGNALYFKAVPSQFLPTNGHSTNGWAVVAPQVSGPFELDLGGQGIRSIEWCLSGLTNAQGQAVQRYLIIGGPASGGPFEKERANEKYSLYAWHGAPGPGSIAKPQKLIDDLRPYTIRPEGLDLIQHAGEWRLLFVEDRFMATGYGVRNAVHWPVTLLGKVE